VLSWYDESVDWLAECVASLAPLCDHVVAVDGRYLLWPTGGAWSHPDQVDAIADTAAAVGLGCTVYQPDQPWVDDEPGKRSFALRLAETLKPQWLFVIDADERVAEVGDDTLDLLARTDCDVGEVDAGACEYTRRVLRAGLGTHSQCRLSYVTAEGEQLSSRLAFSTPAMHERLVPAVRLPITVHTHGHDRGHERNHARSEAYNLATRCNLYPEVQPDGAGRPRGQHVECEWVADTRFASGGRCQRAGCYAASGFYTTCSVARREWIGPWADLMEGPNP
jgi:hypothetical protein